MEISNLYTYVEQISLLNDEYETASKLFPVEFLFRGHSSVNHILLPYLARGRNTSCDVTIFNGERNLIEMAKCKFPDIFRDNMKPLELLALLQHYGIPTRLLDVTESALAALYFACISNPELDGEVFVFLNNSNYVANSPIISAIADTCVLTREAQYSLKNFYTAALNQPYFIEQRHIFEICKDSIDGAEWVEKCCSKPLFVYAPIHTLRQQLQHGRYILFPNKIIDNYLGQNEKAFDTIIEPMPKDHECIKRRYIIKKEEKKKILRDLELCGICESTLFCDSVDKVCNGIIDKVKRML